MMILSILFLIVVAGGFFYAGACHGFRVGVGEVKRRMDEAWVRVSMPIPPEKDADLDAIMARAAETPRWKHSEQPGSGLENWD